jgi:hypothetical protein
MDNLIKASIVITGLIVGTAIVYGLIHLFNQVLYQILVHPGRTMLIVLCIWAIYGIGYVLTNNPRKTNL